MRYEDNYNFILRYIYILTTKVINISSNKKYLIPQP